MLVAGVRYYFVWVTDRRVIFMGLSMMSSRPTGKVAWSDLRSAVSISEATPAATWSWFKYHAAGGRQADPAELPAAVARGLRGR